MKKRVLQFIGSFHQGGSERQAVALTRMLRDDGRFDVYAATLNREGILQEEIEGLGLSEIPEFRLTSFYNANFVRQVRGCASFLRENKIDLVHTHDFYTNVFGMAAATLAGTKARIASKRETGVVRSRSQDFVEKVAFNRAQAIVANSNAVREYLIEREIAAEKINVIHNGIDPHRFNLSTESNRETRQRLGLPGSEEIRFITMVANLRHHVKNVPMLLHAAKRAAESSSNTHFIIAGEGELEPELKAKAVELKITDYVHFLGRCTDVPALLSVSYACVLTSDAEGFSSSILEYMAAGRPVVATDVGGASEAVTEETGFLVAPNDDGALAKCLLELLSNETRASEMGQAGRERVRIEFSVDRQIAKTIGLYEQLI